MGSVGMNSEANGTATHINPAQLSQITGLNVNLDYRMTYARENWSFPAHDNFDGYLVDNIYSQSGVVYPDAGFALAYKAQNVKFAPGIGISYHPLRDFRYNYEEEVRESSGYAQPNERDSLISINNVKNTGRYYAFGLGAGWELNKYITFGLALNYSPAMTGSERKFEKNVLYPDTTQTDTGERSKITPESFSYFLVGFNIIPNDRYQFGFTYQTEYTVDASFHSYNIPRTILEIGRYEEVNPVRLGAAFSYHPRSALLSYLEVEFHYTYWSNYRWREKSTFTVYGADTVSTIVDTTYFDNLENSWEVRVGVEHQFYSKIPARFGFRIFPNPENRRIMATVISAGTGFTIKNFRIDLAGQLTTRASRQESWFGNANRWDAEMNRLEESHLKGTISLSYAFNI
jgi:hypothetical protein